jgi:hypothetical protein
MIEEFAKVLQDRLRKEIHVLVEDVSGGVCTNFDSYKAMTGRIHGLRMAERLLLDLRDTALLGDED